jgi:hypothetical protein
MFASLVRFATIAHMYTPQNTSMITINPAGVHIRRTQKIHMDPLDPTMEMEDMSIGVGASYTHLCHEPDFFLAYQKPAHV